MLNPQQQRAVECLNNCVVVACPGSGKTHMIISKIEYILEQDPAARIVVVTFTKDAAQELKERIAQRIGEARADAVTCGTFHSLSLQMLTRANLTGTLISGAEVKAYVERALLESKVPYSLEDAIELIAACKSNPDYEPQTDHLGRLYNAYIAITERNGVMDFNDMMLNSVRKIKSGELQPMKANYILVDEFQDTDLVQYEFVLLHTRAGSKTTIVGDDDQAIYGFRGALAYEGMQQFLRDANAELITLDTNYRCRAEILGAAGEIIKNNPSRVDKSLFANRGKGGSVSLMSFPNTCDEIDAVIEMIKHISGGNSVPEPTRDKDGNIKATYTVGVNKGEWAIFGRNNHNLDFMDAALKASGIPYVRTSSKRGFWEETVIQFMLSLLRSLTTQDKAGIEQILHWTGIPEADLQKLHALLGDNFFALTQSSQINLKRFKPGTAAILKDFMDLSPGWVKGASRKSDDRHTFVIRGVCDWMISLDKGNRQIKFLRMASDILSKMHGNMLARVDKVLEKPDTNLPCVMLGTLHASKGLEFENVWILSAEEGVIPSAKEGTETEEERRLMYVGMTRAKDKLFVSHSEKHKPSRFLGECSLPVIPIAPASSQQASKGH